MTTSPPSTDPARIPVIIGVGEINDRPTPDAAALDSVELMVAALAAADRDAGGGYLDRCDRLFVVPQISFRELDVPRLLSERLGIAPERINQAEQASGDTPIRHLNDAANAIAAGEADICLVTGGEALRTAARRAASLGDTSGPFKGARKNASDLRQRYGLITPTEIYPLFENATRAAWGQTLEEAQAETGEIWARMSQVAVHSDGAWLKTARSASEIVTTTADNRPIASPYSKLMVANASVNQGAAFIVSSLSTALGAGIAEERLVYVGAGSAAHEAEDPLERVAWTVPPGMRVSLERALDLNGLSIDNLDHVELYSCFPCVPKMARRVIGWPLDRAVTVHGGLTFGGGPIGNYMSHAVAAMVRRLRGGGRYGLLFANGGFCTHNHTIVLSRVRPKAGTLPMSYDFQAEADAARGQPPVLTDAYEGDSTLETCTVVYDRSGEPLYAVVFSRTAEGRIISRVDGKDAEVIALLTGQKGEPVGLPGTTQRSDGALYWRPRPPIPPRTGSKMA